MLEPKIFIKEEAAAIRPGTVVELTNGEAVTVAGIGRYAWAGAVGYSTSHGGNVWVMTSTNNVVCGNEIVDILADSPWIPMAEAEPMPGRVVAWRFAGLAEVFIDKMWEGWQETEWLPVNELPLAMRVYLGVEEI